MTCAEAVGRLWAYLEDDLDGIDRERLEEHLAFCRRCCGELEFADELRGFLRTKTAVELSGDVQGRLERFIDALDGGTGTEPLR